MKFGQLGMPLLDTPDHDPGGIGLLGDGEGNGSGDGDGLVSRPARNKVLIAFLWASIVEQMLAAQKMLRNEFCLILLALHRRSAQILKKCHAISYFKKIMMFHSFPRTRYVCITDLNK